MAHGLAKDLSEPLRSYPDLSADLPLDGSHPLYDRDEVHTIFSEWRTVFNEYNPPRTAVAEAWVPAIRRVHYALPTGLGQAFNFDLLRADFNADQFRAIITENLAQTTTSGGSITWVLSNHDVVRHASRYGLPAGQDYRDWLLTDGRVPLEDRELGLRRARAATLLMLALPGSAYLYQGEELGLFEVADLAPEALQDPIWERTGHTSKGRDGARVPLPWSMAGPSFGFGAGPAHLPQPAWFGASSVEAQDGVAGSTLELYRQALALRRALQTEERLEWIKPRRREVLHFTRPGAWHTVTNFGDQPVPLPAGDVLLSSGPLAGRRLPGATTAWIKA